MKIFNTIMAGLVVGSLVVAPASAFSKLPDNTVTQIENNSFFYEKAPENSLWEIFGDSGKGKNTVCAMQRNFEDGAVMLVKDLTDGEIYLRIKNDQWNFDSDEDVTILFSFIKDGKYTDPVRIEAIPVSNNELILPELSVEFVENWVYYSKFGLFIQKNKHLSEVDLTGTIISVKYMMDCMKLAPSNKGKSI